jgi:tetratricopeptide (TPR) repeat protein
VVVLGHEAWPLGRDGEPDPALEQIRSHEHGGGPVRVLTEVELLEILGLSTQREELGRLYTTEQFARILELPVERIRAWMRGGLIRPVRVLKRLAWFDFREVMGARALSHLIEGGVPAARIRKSLEQIATWHPDAGGILVQLESLTGRAGLRLRLPGGALAAPSGQLYLPFREGAPRTEPALRIFDPRVAMTEEPAPDAEEWFQAGLEAEDRGELAAAEGAYRRSLEIEGAQPVTHFNLGNVRYRRGLYLEAAQSFLAALDLDAEYVECWNNLGNTFACLRKPEDALRSYRRALEIEPEYAEAHANLARLLEERGRSAEARRHWLRYVGAEPRGARAARVREKLGIVRSRTPVASEPSGGALADP